MNPLPALFCFCTIALFIIGGCTGGTGKKATQSEVDYSIGERGLDVLFMLERNDISAEKDSVIRFQTTSKRKAQFSVPFLVLSH